MAKKRLKTTKLPLKTLLDVCDKVELGVSYSHLARQLGVSRETLVRDLKSQGFYIRKHKVRGDEPLPNGWHRPATAPKDRTILGWVKKPAITIDGKVNRGYYCTVSWFNDRWDDGVDHHVITAWQELPEPPQ
jgi:hypothetical protein